MAAGTADGDGQGQWQVMNRCTPTRWTCAGPGARAP